MMICLFTIRNLWPLFTKNDKRLVSWVFAGRQPLNRLRIGDCGDVVVHKYSNRREHFPEKELMQPTPVSRRKFLARLGVRCAHRVNTTPLEIEYMFCAYFFANARFSINATKKWKWNGRESRDWWRNFYFNYKDFNLSFDVFSERTAATSTAGESNFFTIFSFIAGHYFTIYFIMFFWLVTSPGGAHLSHAHSHTPHDTVYFMATSCKTNDANWWREREREKWQRCDCNW